MIQNPEKLVEPVRGWQMFVSIAQVILSELPIHVALGRQHPRQGGVFCLNSLLGTGEPHRAQTRPHGVLTQNEGGPPRGARGVPVVVHEDHAFLGDPVDVRRRPAHHPTVVGTDVPHPDIVVPDDQDVRLLVLLLRIRSASDRQNQRDDECGERADFHVFPFGERFVEAS